MNPFKTLLAATALALTTATANAANVHVLTVSVSQCPKLPKFRPLDHADTSAKALHDLLRGGANVGGRDEFLALSREPAAHPTVGNVRAALKRIAGEAKADDRVVVVFVGHGFENRDGAAVVTSDSELTNPNSFLAVREVVGRVKALPCKDKCVIVDACRDFRDDLKVTEAADYKPSAAEDLNAIDRKRNRLTKEHSVVVVQACAEGQYAYERPNKAGLLTERLIQALTVPGEADADGNGSVTVREAVDYARKHVRQDARDLHRAVQSVTDVSEGDPFPLAAVGKRDVAVAQTPPAPAVAPAGPLPTHDIAFGHPATPSSPMREGGFAAGTTFMPSPVAHGFGQPAPLFQQPYPVMNAMVNGIPTDSRVGMGLTVARPFVPAEAQRYLPAAGVPIGPQIANMIRR